MYGMSDSYSIEEVLDKVIFDIQKEQLNLYKTEQKEDAEALEIAIKVCEKHKKMGYG